MTPAPIVLLGASGLGREVGAAIAALNARCPTWRVLGYLDDDPALEGTTVGEHRVLGPLEAAAAIADVHRVVCVTGRSVGPRLRSSIAARIPGPYATIVHPAASIGAGTTLGPGSVLLAGVVATADVTLGGHCVLMPHVVLTHDDVLDDNVVCGAGVTLAGGVHVGEGAYLGAGCSVRERTHVGAWSTVGMGAAVLADVPRGEVWAGVPARPLRRSRSVAGVPA